MPPPSSNQYNSLQTVRRVAQFPSIGKTFPNGISNKYDDTIPQSLRQVLPTRQMTKFIKYFDHLNYKVSQYWPCSTAYYCGWVLCPFTVGLSLCLPLVCVRQVQQVIKREIKRINQDILKEKKLEMRLIKKLCQSEIVIQEIDFSEFEI